jgi:hypothetical protein
MDWSDIYAMPKPKGGKKHKKGGENIVPFVKPTPSYGTLSWGRENSSPKVYIGEEIPTMKVEFLGGTPKIYATPEAMHKMQAYTELCSDEIGWLGDVEELGGMRYLITDVFLAKQTVSGATCNLTPEGILELIEERLIAGEEVSNMKMWGHSHVNMGAFASGQDETQFKELQANSTDFFIRLIMNKRDDFHITFIDIARQIQWTELPITVYVPHSIDKDLIRAEIKDKVTKQVYTYTAGQYGGKYPGYGGYQGYNAALKSSLYEDDGITPTGLGRGFYDYD